MTDERKRGPLVSADDFPWGSCDMSAGDAIDSAKTWEVVFDKPYDDIKVKDRRPTRLKACLVVGRLVAISHPGDSMHEGQVVFWADEAYEIAARGGTGISRSLLCAKCLFGGVIELSPRTRVEIFGGRPPLSKEEIDEMWKGWSRPVRRRWIARKKWSESRMVDKGREPTMAHRLWAANYATRRLKKRGFIK